MDPSSTIGLHGLDDSKVAQDSPTLPSSAAVVGLRVETPDEVLMAEVGEGSREALAILFCRHARSVRSVAFRAVRDSAEADDLVQDIFLLIARDAKAFDRAKGAVRAWILRIAHRRAISRHRYLRSRHFYNRVDLDDLVGELGDLSASGGQPGDSIGEAFGQGRLDRVFQELSLNQRETLRLHFFEGYSLAEIAAKLGQSRGNIKHHYFRGLERLRKELFTGKLQSKGTVW